LNQSLSFQPAISAGRGLDVTSEGMAVFLDRDGVINVDHGYVHRIADFQFLPGALEGASLLHGAGYQLIVITNQAGIAHGYFDEAAYSHLTRWMQAQFAAAGAPLAGVYHCPHHPEARLEQLRRECSCRKPSPGLILRAIADHRIDPSKSALVGDKPSDIEAALLAGIARRFLVRSVHVPPNEPGVFDSLLSVARHIEGSG
jgi:D-glycero-D-manno-heptose 1,7-bisphosphate phosphatase